MSYFLILVPSQFLSKFLKIKSEWSSQFLLEACKVLGLWGSLSTCASVYMALPDLDSQSPYCPGCQVQPSLGFCACDISLEGPSPRFCKALSQHPRSH